MGFEILYCARCGTRILGEDFDRGTALWVGDRGVCWGCVRKELAVTRSVAGRPVVLRRYRRLKLRSS